MDIDYQKNLTYTLQIENICIIYIEMYFENFC